MLKIVVYDGGMGGELFADYLETELPIVQVIRVIDWRHLEDLSKSRHKARITAEAALKPYIGKVDLIVLANHLLGVTSLRYFERTYKNQQFTGFKFPTISTFVPRETILLTTTALTRTLKFKLYLRSCHRDITTVVADDWPSKIDDATLSGHEVRKLFVQSTKGSNNFPKEVIIACAHFSDFVKYLNKHSVKVHDSYRETLIDIYRKLKIRGIPKQKS
ncbi:hypothetical protein IJJ37_02005 [Candidatus Saccharibacteria bacterium]|nr:hypothetical protein [Candidatus Saccharibacteria bacterium]